MEIGYKTITGDKVFEFSECFMP